VREDHEQRELAEGDEAEATARDEGEGEPIGTTAASSEASDARLDGASPDAASPDAAPDATPHAPPLRELRGRDRWLRILAMTFTGYHLVAMLVGGSVPAVRRVAKPLFGFYADGLRMTNSWGMFARPPDASHVVVEATLTDGSKRLLATTRASDRSAFERIRDVRMRKTLSRLTEPKERSDLGHAYLEHYCRTAQAELGQGVRVVRAIAQHHELRDMKGEIRRRPHDQTLFSRSCDQRGAPVVDRRPAFIERLRRPAPGPSASPTPDDVGDP
jgi:hypothetical protein